MARPRDPITHAVLLAHVRAHQPVTVLMLTQHFQRSAPFVRGLLDALADTGLLALAPARPRIEGDEGGRPSKLYCLPDWPGLPKNKPVDIPALTGATVLELLVQLGPSTFEVLHAMCECPASQLRATLRELAQAGHTKTENRLSLTHYVHFA